MRAVITLTTDFGTLDTYVGAMKGVILGMNPEAIVVDICHDIEPQNLAQAAYLLSTAYPYYPPGSIHVVVVDPGVGSARRAILLVAPSAFFIAPDNGVLTYVLRELNRETPKGSRRGALKAELGPGLQAFSLTESRFWRPTVSSTFHGRDVFAPVAAHLSLGVPPSHFGEALSSLTVIPVPQPSRQAGAMIGHVIHIDRFGNLITDIGSHDLPGGDVAIEVRGRRIEGLSLSYAEGGELLAIIGSSDRLEIAARNDSAAWQLGARIGDEVQVVLVGPRSGRRT